TNVSKAHQVARALRAGSVWVNCYQAMDPAVPFGGYKMSGYGREFGKPHLEEYLKGKAVWVKTALPIGEAPVLPRPALRGVETSKACSERVGVRGSFRKLSPRRQPLTRIAPDDAPHRREQSGLSPRGEAKSAS